MNTCCGAVCSRAALILALLIVAGSEAAGQTRTSSCPASSAEIERQIAGFRGHPPTAVSLGTYVILSNPATVAVARAGTAAADALLRASRGEDRIVAAYAIHTLGEIFAGSKSAGACKDEVTRTLRELRAGYETSAGSLLNRTVLGQIRVVLDRIDVVPSPDGVPAPETCCVDDATILVEGTFVEKTLEDYYPQIAQDMKEEKADPIWDKPDMAGPFDIEQLFSLRNRAGGVMQFIAKCSGDRDLCRLTQSYIIPDTTYPGVEVTEAPVNDLDGVDMSRPPDRQNLSGNRISMADATSVEYGAGLDNYKHVQVFTTCAESASPQCPWDRCCVQWTRETVIEQEKVKTNTIVWDRKWCEKIF